MEHQTELTVDSVQFFSNFDSGNLVRAARASASHVLPT